MQKVIGSGVWESGKGGGTEKCTGKRKKGAREERWGGRNL